MYCIILIRNFVKEVSKNLFGNLKKNNKGQKIVRNKSTKKKIEDIKKDGRMITHSCRSWGRGDNLPQNAKEMGKTRVFWAPT